MKPVIASELPHIEMVRKSSGETLSTVASISDAFGLSKLLIHREIIPPGKRTAPIHQHSHKEEAFFVESGSPTLWFEGRVQQLSAGEVVGFKPSDGMRMIYNDSLQDAVIWTVGTNDSEDVVGFSDT